MTGDLVLNDNRDFFCATWWLESDSSERLRFDGFIWMDTRLKRQHDSPPIAAAADWEAERGRPWLGWQPFRFLLQSDIQALHLVFGFIQRAGVVDDKIGLFLLLRVR